MALEVKAAGRVYSRFNQSSLNFCNHHSFPFLQLLNTVYKIVVLFQN